MPNTHPPPSLDLDEDWGPAADLPDNPTPLTAVESPRALPADSGRNLFGASSRELSALEVSPREGASRSFRSVQKPVADVTARLEGSICAFWLGSNCFGLDVALVGEVVNVESVLPVPLAPAPLFGLFNLRGTAVALVDLASVLEIAAVDAGPTASAGPWPALVLRSGELVAAALIDRMESVISREHAIFTRKTDGDRPIVKGFVEVPGRGGLVVTLLDATAVVESLKRLRYGTS